MNLETVTDIFYWYKTWQHSGYNHTHVKQKLPRKQKRAYKSSWSRIGSLKSFTLTIPWNLTYLVKIFHGIIARLHHIDRRLMGLLKQQYAEKKKAPLLYCCNQVWMKNGGQIPWNITAICETLKISCLMGKIQYERRFGKPFKGQITPFGSLVECYPISAEDLSRIHQFGKKILPGLFLEYTLYAGGIWKGDIMFVDIEELEKMDASEIYSRRLCAKEVLTSMGGEKFIFPIADGTVKLSGGEQGDLAARWSLSSCQARTMSDFYSKCLLMEGMSTCARVYHVYHAEQSDWLVALCKGTFHSNA